MGPGSRGAGPAQAFSLGVAANAITTESGLSFAATQRGTAGGLGTSGHYARGRALAGRSLRSPRRPIHLGGTLILTPFLRALRLALELPEEERIGSSEMTAAVAQAQRAAAVLGPVGARQLWGRTEYDRRLLKVALEGAWTRVDQPLKYLLVRHIVPAGLSTLRSLKKELLRGDPFESHSAAEVPRGCCFGEFLALRCLRPSLREADNPIGTPRQRAICLSLARAPGRGHFQMVSRKCRHSREKAGQGSDRRRW